MMKIQILAVTVIFLFFTSGAIAANDDTNNWQEPLCAALKNHFEITTRDWAGKVKKPGTILVVKQDGIQADEPKAFMKPTVIITGM